MRLRLMCVLVLAGGCSGGGGEGSIDAALLDGSPGDAGRADASVSLCPDEPPADGADCAGELVETRCAWERCESVGLVQAYCAPGSGEGNVPPRWELEAVNCEETSCNGDACGDDTVCAVYQGGAQMLMCAQHACGAGPLTCDCVCGDYECTEGDGSGSGQALFTCNTCSGNLCP